MRDEKKPASDFDSSLIPHPSSLLNPSSLLESGHFLDRPAGRMHYLDEGRGDPIVMLHGNPTWSFYYRNLVLALRDSHRCIVPDHIGCGLSEKPDADRYPYTLA